jgi:hypothetical protein
MPYAVFLIALLFSCENQPPSETAIRAARINPIGTVYVAPLSTASRIFSRSAHKAFDDWNVAFQEQADGSTKEVTYLDAKGNEVRLDVTDIISLSDGFLGVSYQAAQDIDGNEAIPLWGVPRLALRLSDGAAFDMSEYDLNGSMIHSGFLFTVSSDGTIYKIATADFSTAVPMNNPAYDPLPHPGTNIFQEKAFLATGENDLIHWHKVYFFDTRIPPLSLGGNAYTIAYDGKTGEPRAWIYDKGGNLYAIFYNWHRGGPAILPQAASILWARVSADPASGITTSDASGLSFAATPNPQWMYDIQKDWSITSERAYIPAAPSGFVTVTPKESGIEVAWTDLAMDDSVQNGTVAGGHYYWQETGGNRRIRRIKLEAGSAAETLVDETGTREGFSVVGAKVIYKRNISAIDVYTYSKAPGSPSELLYESSVEPQSIVRL